MRMIFSAILLHAHLQTLKAYQICALRQLAFVICAEANHHVRSIRINQNVGKVIYLR